MLNEHVHPVPAAHGLARTIYSVAGAFVVQFVPAVVVLPSAVKYNPLPLLSPYVSTALGDTPQFVHPEHVDNAEPSFVVDVVQELSLYHPVAPVFL